MSWDLTAPGITCATNNTVEFGSAWTFDPPTATDLNSNTIAIVSTTTNFSGHCGNTFDATRTWSATDTCGNSNVCSQTVMGLDRNAHGLMCASNTTVEFGRA